MKNEPTVNEWSKMMDAERQRQIEKGYDHTHDVAHGVEHILTWAIDYARKGDSLASATMIRSALQILSETIDTNPSTR